MQRRGVTSINNKTDKLILTQLATTTYSAMGGAAQAGMTLNPILDAIAALDANVVPDDGEALQFADAAGVAWLMKVNQFSSGDWVSDKPYMKRVQWRDWGGVRWCRHPNLPGVGGATASCFVYHKAACGHGLNMGDMVNKVGNNDEAGLFLGSHVGLPGRQGPAVVRHHQDRPQRYDGAELSPGDPVVI